MHCAQAAAIIRSSGNDLQAKSKQKSTSSQTVHAEFRTDGKQQWSKTHFSFFWLDAPRAHEFLRFHSGDVPARANVSPENVSYGTNMKFPVW